MLAKQVSVPVDNHWMLMVFLAGIWLEIGVRLFFLLI